MLGIRGIVDGVQCLAWQQQQHELPANGCLDFKKIFFSYKNMVNSWSQFLGFFHWRFRTYLKYRLLLPIQKITYFCEKIVFWTKNYIFHRFTARTIALDNWCIRSTQFTRRIPPPPLTPHLPLGKTTSMRRTILGKQQQIPLLTSPIAPNNI